MRITKRQIKRIIREEKRKVLVEKRIKQLVQRHVIREQDAVGGPAEAETSETGGATITTIKKGLSIAFPEWGDAVDKMDLKTNFVDEFAGLIKNAMQTAESGALVKAAAASEKLTSRIAPSE
jgi:hypothetical protein